MSPSSRPRLDWYQDGDAVSIVLYETAVKPASISVAWSNNILKISYATDTDNNAASAGDDATTLRSLELRLSSPIVDPATTNGACKLLCSKKKLEMQFRKATSRHWETLEVPDESTVYSGPNGYSKVDERCLERELVDDTSYDSENQFIKLLQDIYNKGDEETKRAMMKSFKYSNGTMLSTDWNQVKEENFC